MSRGAEMSSWDCMACGDVNPMSKDVCRKCGKPHYPYHSRGSQMCDDGDAQVKFDADVTTLLKTLTEKVTELEGRIEDLESITYEEDGEQDGDDGRTDSHE